MTAILTAKCTDCGLLLQQKGSVKELGLLEGNNCPNCGGEVIFLPHPSSKYP